MSDPFERWAEPQKRRTAAERTQSSAKVH
jgi:hypothetical protein